MASLATQQQAAAAPGRSSQPPPPWVPRGSAGAAAGQDRKRTSGDAASLPPRWVPPPQPRGSAAAAAEPSQDVKPPEAEPGGDERAASDAVATPQRSVPARPPPPPPPPPAVATSGARRVSEPDKGERDRVKGSPAQRAAATSADEQVAARCSSSSSPAAVALKPTPNRRVSAPAVPPPPRAARMDSEQRLEMIQRRFGGKAEAGRMQRSLTEDGTSATTAKSSTHGDSATAGESPDSEQRLPIWPPPLKTYEAKVLAGEVEPESLSDIRGAVRKASASEPQEPAKAKASADASHVPQSMKDKLVAKAREVQRRITTPKAAPAPTAPPQPLVYGEYQVQLIGWTKAPRIRDRNSVARSREARLRAKNENLEVAREAVRGLLHEQRDANERVDRFIVDERGIRVLDPAGAVLLDAHLKGIAFMITLTERTDCFGITHKRAAGDPFRIHVFRCAKALEAVATLSGVCQMVFRKYVNEARGVSRAGAGTAEPQRGSPSGRAAQPSAPAGSVRAAPPRRPSQPPPPRPPPPGARAENMREESAADAAADNDGGDEEDQENEYMEYEGDSDEAEP